MITTYILLKVEHSKPIPELSDIAAGRVYTLNNVDDVTAIKLTEESGRRAEYWTDVENGA